MVERLRFECGGAPLVVRVGEKTVALFVHREWAKAPTPTTRAC
jgi:hypothetical protein